MIKRRTLFIQSKHRKIFTGFEQIFDTLPPRTYFHSDDENEEEPITLGIEECKQENEDARDKAQSTYHQESIQQRS